MATKEEHLGRETAAFLEDFGRIDAGEGKLLVRLSEALAERDAAREELAKPVEQAAKSLRNSLALEVGIDPGMHIDFILRAALDRLHFMEQAAQPVAEAPAQSFKQTTVQVGCGVSILPPAPPQETAHGGPFTRMGSFIMCGGSNWLRIVDGSSAHRATEAVRLLNAGLEAPKLRARVAELETRERNNIEALIASRDHEKARADAAEKRVAELDAKLATFDDGLRNAIERADDASKRLKAARVELDQERGYRRVHRAEIDALRENLKAAEAKLRDREDTISTLEAKLAALGENPIPRALVEKWGVLANSGMLLAGPSFVLDSILAGREPGDGGAP